MGQWVVTVAGIAILAVLCDVILPEGQTRKYIKTVIGIIVTLVMIQPLTNFIGGSVNDGGIGSSGNSSVQIQQSYLDMVEEKQIKSNLTIVKDMLDLRGIDVEIKSVDSGAQTIEIQADIPYSAENKSVVDKAFNTYFSDYKITIKWK